MAGNIFKEARLRAAKNDERFRTAESAALELHNMSRETIYDRARKCKEKASRPVSI